MPQLDAVDPTAIPEPEPELSGAAAAMGFVPNRAKCS
jgi:hypothetical protein